MALSPADPAAVATAPSPRPLRVLRVMPMLGGGGAEVQCLEVMAELAAHEAQYGIHCELATFYRPFGAMPSLPPGVTHHFLESPRKLSGLLAASRKLGPLLENYDLVHALLWPAIWAVAFARRRAGLPFLASFFSTWQKPGPLAVKRMADIVLIRRATALSTLSETSRDYLAHYHYVHPSAFHIVPDGKRAYGGPALPRSGLIAVMRAAPPKRHDLLFAALASQPGAERPQLSCCGFGTDTPLFRERAERLGLNNVQGHGEVQDVLTRVAGAQALLLATEYEGLPNAVLEAWGCGTPVLASRVPGVQELIRDGVDGLLVENTAEAWSAAIQRILGDQALAAELAAAGRERVLRDFSLEHCAGEWAALYKKLAGSH